MRERDVAQDHVGGTAGNVQDAAGVVAAERDQAAVVVGVAIDGDILGQLRLTLGQCQRLALRLPGQVECRCHCRVSDTTTTSADVDQNREGLCRYRSASGRGSAIAY